MNSGTTIRYLGAGVFAWPFFVLFHKGDGKWLYFHHALWPFIYFPQKYLFNPPPPFPSTRPGQDPGVDLPTDSHKVTSTCGSVY